MKDGYFVSLFSHFRPIFPHYAPPPPPPHSGTCPYIFEPDLWMIPLFPAFRPIPRQLPPVPPPITPQFPPPPISPIFPASNPWFGELVSSVAGSADPCTDWGCGLCVLSLRTWPSVGVPHSPSGPVPSSLRPAQPPQPTQWRDKGPQDSVHVLSAVRGRDRMLDEAAVVMDGGMRGIAPHVCGPGPEPRAALGGPGRCSPGPPPGPQPHPSPRAEPR